MNSLFAQEGRGSYERFTKGEAVGDRVPPNLSGNRVGKVPLPHPHSPTDGTAVLAASQIQLSPLSNPGCPRPAPNSGPPPPWVFSTSSRSRISLSLLASPSTSPSSGCVALSHFLISDAPPSCPRLSSFSPISLLPHSAADIP